MGTANVYRFVFFIIAFVYIFKILYYYINDFEVNRAFSDMTHHWLTPTLRWPIVGRIA